MSIPMFPADEVISYGDNVFVHKPPHGGVWHVWLRVNSQYFRISGNVELNEDEATWMAARLLEAVEKLKRGEG